MRIEDRKENQVTEGFDAFSNANFVTSRPVANSLTEESLIGSDIGKELGIKLLEVSAALPIILIPAAKKVGVSELREIIPDGDIVVCDFYIDTIEQIGSLTEISIPTVKDAFGSILNIDHHAPILDMEKPISSGNLAVSQVVQYGPIPTSIPIIINHTDCDSVISSLIMRGILPPLRQFGTAVICADHTGEVNPIADLLQSLESRRDLAFSVRNLGLLLAGEPLEVEAQQLLAHRMHQREEVQEIADNFSSVGVVSYALIDDRIPGELLQSVLPESGLIMLGLLPEGRSDTLQVSIRLGNAALPGITLHRLRINEFDPHYGGRWNAGANKRAGGFAISEDSTVEATLSQYATNLALAYARESRELLNQKTA
jgi:hypothetical protein